MTRERYEDSTANLTRHVKGCDPSDDSATQKIVAYANGSTYSPAKLRFLLAMWCARRHRPFLIIEDPELGENFHMLYGRIKLPSRVTISRDVREIFMHCHENVAEILDVRVELC